MRRYLFLALLLAAPTLYGTSSVKTGARVVPFFVAEVKAQPVSIVISDDDVANGFVDVGGAALEIRSNDPNGYLVTFQLDRTLVERVEVEGLQSEVTISGASGFAAQRFGQVGTVNVTMRYRFYLSRKCESGTYAFPLRVSVHRLD